MGKKILQKEKKTSTDYFNNNPFADKNSDMILKS